MASLTAAMLALAGCSSSSEGGSGEATATTTTATHATSAGAGSGGGTGAESGPSGVGTTGAGGDAGSGGDGAGGELPDEYFFAADAAYEYFQGDFDSYGQLPQVEGDVVPPPRRLVGCAVDAPELGERVVYVERTDPESDGPPDRQFLMAFVPKPEVGYYDALATILRPIDPTEWEGRCEPGTMMSLVGPVTDEDHCRFTLQVFDDVFDELTTSFAGPMPAACWAPYAGASEVEPYLAAWGGRVDWLDELIAEDGTRTRDPATTPPDAYESSYEMEVHAD